VKVFFKWLAGEGEVERDPTQRIKPPQPDQVAKDIATTDELQLVFARLERTAKDRKVLPSDGLGRSVTP
jgi:site-specific recombinase XerD